MNSITVNATIGLAVALLALVLISAFFSAAETAYSTVPRHKIEEDARNGKKVSIRISKHYKKFGWVLSTILICNNIVNIFASTLVTYVFTSYVSSDIFATIYSTCLMAPVIIIIGEIIPKLLARKYSYGYLKKIVYVMTFLNYLFFPLTYPLSKLTLQTKLTNTEQDIKSIINVASSEGALENEEAKLVQNALDFDSILVKSTMVEVGKIIRIRMNSSVVDAKILFKKTGYSRLPVVNPKTNKFVGIILLKDVFSSLDGTINNFIKKIATISQYELASNILSLMRQLKTQMLFVSAIDNSKEIIGLITMEDLIEQLVGKIYDEHDKEELIHQVDLNKWIVNSDVKLSEVEKIVNHVLNNTNVDLEVGAWLKLNVEKDVKPGLVWIYHEKIKFEVVEMKNQTISVISISHLE